MRWKFGKESKTPYWLQFLIIAATLGVCVPIARSQSFSPFSDFQSLTTTQLTTLQVKLTFAGPQEKPIQTVAFTATGNTLDLSKFVPFQRPGIPYGNDEGNVRSFEVSVQELQSMLQKVAQIPAVVSGGVANSIYVSFAMVSSVTPITKGFEAVLNFTDSGALFQALRSAFDGDAAALQAINDMGCRITLLPPGVPNDVTTNASVAVSGLRLNRTTGLFVGTATVTNNSGSSISGPISLVFELPGGVSLANSDGHTCATTPEGRAFINLPLQNNALAPGASVQVGLQFNNPNLGPIQPTIKVLAGPGAR